MSSGTENKRAKSVLYPIIEQIICHIWESQKRYASRDEIANKLIEHPEAFEIIKNSVSGSNPGRSELWEKAGNYVDWLNADITRLDPIAEKWCDGFYARKRQKTKHPFNNKERDIYFMAPNRETISDEVDEIITDTTIDETERLQLLRARVGQGTFREALIKYWQGCSVTGCKEISLLRASHIKPWRYSTNTERLDLYNGLLLIPNLDAAFDRGFISFDEDGSILISPCINSKDIDILGINSSMKIDRMEERHKMYMNYHRNNHFKS